MKLNYELAMLHLIFQESSAETLKGLAPSCAEPKPTKPIVKDEPAKVQEQKITSLSPYAM